MAASSDRLRIMVFSLEFSGPALAAVSTIIAEMAAEGSGDGVTPGRGLGALRAVGKVNSTQVSRRLDAHRDGRAGNDRGIVVLGVGNVEAALDGLHGDVADRAASS